MPKKAQPILPFTLIIFFLLTSCKVTPEKETISHNYTDPDIGGVGWLLQPTRPTVSLPNRMIRMYPVRPDYLSDQISYFPLTLKSHRKGELFGIMPFAGEITDSTWTQMQMFDHDLETTNPWYYSTCFIDSNIVTEFTPGAKAGIFRFTFPGNQPQLIRLQINNPGEWSALSGNSVEGTESFEGMKAYVYGVFNTEGIPKKTVLTVTDTRRKTQKKLPVVLLAFPDQKPATILFKYGISFISPEQARKNLQEEITGWGFNETEDRAKKLWLHKLNKIKVKGGTESQRRVFYTALYRCYERMVNITEDGKYYSAYDHRVHETEHDFYVDDWIWDTYLALHPLRMILDPETETDMLRSYISMYKQSGWMPQFPLLYGDDPAMHGFHSTIVFLDAWRKGIRDLDMEEAYEGMRKNATGATMLPWRNGPLTCLDTFYREKGYFPALRPGEKETVNDVHPFERRQAVAITLAHSYDDWALAEMAKELGRQKDFEYFTRQALNYRNLYKPDIKMFMPKDAEGNWIDIDPKFDGGPGGRDYFDENNGYTYAWQGQHDIRGLIQIKGGRVAFTALLDQLFREDLGRSKYQFWAKFPDATGLVGQYSMGNEPSFYIPYLYNYSGAPWKTQKHIRFLLDTWFMDNIFGIPGDEDGGGMSAFVVFSMMGFYPVTPGLPVYNIGSPVFEKISIQLPTGKTFSVIAHHYAKENKYIQSAKLNGKPWDKPWFTHEDLMKGGKLDLEMGAYPNKQWGSAPDAAPPSGVEKTDENEHITDEKH